MSILVVLIGLSIVLLAGAGIVLFWAVDHGQFDDMETPRLLPLTDVVPAEDDAAGHGTRDTAGPGTTP